MTTARNGAHWWIADFKDASKVTTSDRRRWDAHRDLYVEVEAATEETARKVVFEVAKTFIARPYLGTLKIKRGRPRVKFQSKS